MTDWLDALVGNCSTGLHQNLCPSQRQTDTDKGVVYEAKRLLASVSLIAAGRGEDGHF